MINRQFTTQRIYISVKLTIQKSNKNYTLDSIKNEFISFIFEQKAKKKLYSYRRNSQELLD